MNKLLVVVIAVAIVAVALAAAVGYESYSYSKVSSNYNTVSADLSQVQSSAVLQDAFAHWDYIAIENVSLLEPQYTTNATLHWIGGPLTGTYHEVNNITTVWGKFFNLWSAVWFYTITPPSVSVNGNMATVLSQNQFVLTPFTDPQQVQYLNISYNLGYVKSGSDWLIYNETWDIVGAGFISLAQNPAELNEVTAEAFSHWNNIAIENNTTVMEQYLPNATLNWVGGPLNGTYHGNAAINETWNKFFAMWSAVWFYSEMPPVITVSGNMANVEATIQFVVQNSQNLSQFEYINVSYSITYMQTGFNSHNGSMQYMIYNEIFKITGKGALESV